MGVAPCPRGGNPTAPCTHLTGYCGTVLPVPCVPCPTACPFLGTCSPAKPCCARWSPEAAQAFPWEPPCLGSHHLLSRCRGMPGSGTSILPLCSAKRASGAQRAAAPCGCCPTPTVPPRHLAAAQPDGQAQAMPHSLHTWDLRERLCLLWPPPPAQPCDAQPGPSPPDLSYLPTVVAGWARLAGARSPAALPLLPAWDQSTFKTLPFPAPGNDTPAQPCQKHAGQPSPQLPRGAWVPLCRGSSCTRPLRPHHRLPCAMPLWVQEQGRAVSRGERFTGPKMAAVWAGGPVLAGSHLQAVPSAKEARERGGRDLHGASVPELL